MSNSIDLLPADGGTTWSVVASWTHSGDVASVDFTGLGGYTDYRIFLDSIVHSTTANHRVVFSDDNGSTFYTTSGNYQFISTVGTITNDVASYGLASGQTGTRSSFFDLPGFGVVGIKKTFRSTGLAIAFKGSTNAINAFQIGVSAGVMQGGSIEILAR